MRVDINIPYKHNKIILKNTEAERERESENYNKREI